MSDWKRKTIKGAIVSISKDFSFNDKETGEPKRCLRFRLQVGTDLQPCVAFAEVADEIADLGVSRESHSFEVVERPGTEEVRVNFVLKGKAMSRDLRKEEQERVEFFKKMLGSGFRLVPMMSGEQKLMVWKPLSECRLLNGIWQHDLEIALDLLPPGTVGKAINGLNKDRETFLIKMKELADEAVNNYGKNRLDGISVHTAEHSTDGYEYDYGSESVTDNF